MNAYQIAFLLGLLAIAHIPCTLLESNKIGYHANLMIFFYTLAILAFDVMIVGWKVGNGLVWFYKLLGTL